MFAPSTPQYWLGRFAFGCLLIAFAGLGIVARGNPLLGVVAGFWGFYLAITATQPLVRMATIVRHSTGSWSRAANEAFARASLPRRIYYLLAAVAEVDGPMTEGERQTVRRFVLERFLDAIAIDELRLWEAQPLPLRDRAGLAARIAPNLEQPEIDSLFCWCCMVAFADGKYAASEHQVLQEVARGFGLTTSRARMLFHLARAQYLRDQGRAEPDRHAPYADARSSALQTLGLPLDATPEQIRKRHRELVRRFHPDAQPNLGPVAQREATERFQAIQRAYELLRT
ncbi:MAG: DnaJ domain-containing protein [Planctomycetes bacterium]|nr:DnaJ domain-containing protein [Planctomycetota bacterium]MCB9884668.1 DnaJ domain-containing protein [Planctomycetota bacterium]